MLKKRKMRNKKKTSAFKSVMLYKGQIKWVYIFLIPTIVVFCMFYLIPICTAIVTSFTKWNGFTAPEYVGFDNYMKVFKNDVFIIALKNLAYWSLIAATVHVGFGVLVAFVLARKPLGSNMVRVAMLFPNVISVSAWAMIYRYFFNDEIGLLNSFIRIFIPDFSLPWFYQSPAAFWAVTITWVFFAGVVTLTVYNDLMAIPSSLSEAARIDGANELQVAMRIQLPLCRSSIGTGIIMSITARISMYEKIVLTTRGGPGDDTMALPIMMVNAIQDMRYGYANAIAVIMIFLGVLVMGGVNKLMHLNESTYE